ncbi:xanthine dehydrogenase family protein molybdopterin-binding subunit [Celeribacter indicus]|uniref:Xanthine dehydrogenase n=1 Tax=Celeribacter indicus TaxID=1208324 RepID=A0A0B5DVU5_9RHOB|nr:xanthine dehydrogenase family protein molybdopterin-binding subunit [Celeribacter indicus]AJE44881.1 xanthine dehydrogenase [Celeribacter indicus]SDX22885.1 CO or xanthine dehydrogenase, Mo-binding subunit [Celeribacter indicus]
MNDQTTQSRAVGASHPRREAREKVTGRIEYIHNLRLPNMLHGKICRSTVAHARIVSVDTSEAEAHPGVELVLTGEDIRKVMPEPYFGVMFHDQPVLALDKVRYVGEPVALVLAADPNVAAEAVALIDVRYDELEPVFDEVDALSSTSYVHEELKPGVPEIQFLKGVRDTNVGFPYQLRHGGDVDAAFEAAEHVFEHEFRTHPSAHVPLEPPVTVAEPTGPGLTLHTANQSPSFVAYEIARLLNWPQSKVRVRVPYLGGGFGAKLWIRLEALVAAAALLAKRPVKVSLSMEEQFYTITKHGATLRIKSGVDKDGRITARKCEVYWNGGAYADIGPAVAFHAGMTAAGPYDIPDVAINSLSVYTNRPVAGAMRGFGHPQLIWAYENHTDMMAHELCIDPLDFRRRNILREGSVHATGTALNTSAVEKALDRVTERLNWGKPFDKGNGTIRRGRGFAIGIKASIAPSTSEAMVRVSSDGSATLYCSSVDMGQGADTAHAQIVAEVLDIPVQRVNIVHPDTDVTPYDTGTLGSRTLYHMGHAIRLAALDARAKLEEMAAESGSNVPIWELFARKNGLPVGNVIGTGSFTPPGHVPPDPMTGQSSDITPYWMVGATGAEVEVDTETGRVTILRLVNVADAGTPINPQIVDHQISGASIMQLGQTMQEKVHFDYGQVTNASFADYKIPSMLDIPAIENALLEGEEAGGPFGAKGAGETGTFCVSSAVANAVFDAVGVRVHEMPITGETVYRALRKAANDPLEEDQDVAL